MGTGVPADGRRDIPDVSLFASNGFVGQAYLICQADQNGDCPSSFLGFGGTSVSSPAFAGIMALINQKTGERQGNANYVFYKLAAKAGASCTSGASEASSCIFNDVTVGTNAGPCTPGSQNCVTNNAGDAYGVLSGYNAGSGYDLATGLGSVNANNLVNAWASVSSLPSTTTLTGVTPTTITHGQALNFTVTVKPQSGTGTPTGDISLIGPTTINNTSEGIAGFNLSNGTVTATTELLPGGTYSLTAHYPGDANYAASDSPGISVTVGKESSQPHVFLVTFDANGNIISGNTNTAVYGSLYILRVNLENSAGQVCAPAAASGAMECPSGKVILTNNDSALDAGTYALNSDGYFEDLAVQLPGGADSVKAAYAGDNSFKASSATSTIAITPGATTMSAPSVSSGASVGQAAFVSVNVNTTSTGVAPSGTVTFYANGKALGGTVAYNPNGGGSAGSASLGANLATNTAAFPVVGTYAITANYSGDANYAASASSARNIAVLYPQPAVSANPYAPTIQAGSTVTESALVDTTNKTTYPTGTVTLFSNSVNGPLAGPIACTGTTDSSGNYACHATFVLSPSASTNFWVQYSGDANYPAGVSGGYYINVIDFALSPGTQQVTVNQGQSQTVAINVASLSGFAGVVSNFSCNGLPAETACSFSPSQVSGQGSTTLTITTASLGQMRRRASAENRRPLWGVGTILPWLGLCLIGIPAVRRRRAVLPALGLVAMLITLISCGGGGGGGQAVNNPVPSITSLAPTQQAAGSTSQALTINGSGFVNASAVTYNGVAHTASFVSTAQLSVALTANDLTATGTYPVVVTNPSPGGGASGSVDFDVVTGTPSGNFTVTVGASSGSLAHNTTFTLAVQ
jgi:hypothetical protein